MDILERICPQCGAEFLPKKHNQKYDTPKCAQRAAHRRRILRETKRLIEELQNDAD